MSKCFADTAYFLALVSPADAAHASASAYPQSPADEMFTTSAVLIELGGHLSRPVDRPLLVGLINDLRQTDSFRLVHLDSNLLNAGWQLFQDRPDKNWSLTDCISFVLMRQLAITDAATTDRHFKQAGFNILLAPNS
jgi:predicted nucleic acid-binding protein